jgi:sec-independent protein translocase protein TatA
LAVAETGSAGCRARFLIPGELLQYRFEGAYMFEGLFQPMHLLMIFGIALLVFGPKKLPELGKGIGEGIRGFKSAINTKEEQKAASITNVIAGDQS